MTEHLSVTIQTPEMTMEQYAKVVGVSKDTVEGWIKRGYLPSVKLGKYRMVNVIQRAVECANDQ